ncbi:hypothetical protein DDK07_03370 [Mycobacteroides abscessus]|nr:hypothetical protein MA6G0125S_4535 [Mycobacteroides abscessus 6G-0125-S]EIU95646.1 hypothetical protein MA6G0728R_4461 [Mycobacteroides abscessus 6G-0728-R]OTQ92625.1 hypothetical protein B9M85_22480 [Mycobacteroides abscessus]RTZ45168.1 hypothetical protein CJN95_020580 [Mycobacteroides abscessus subsp. abscessus]OTR15957.1 hypothetical protein B9M80_23285 [Mycobacteroides abscessus]
MLIFGVAAVMRREKISPRWWCFRWFQTATEVYQGRGWPPMAPKRGAWGWGLGGESLVGWRVTLLEDGMGDGVSGLLSSTRHRDVCGSPLDGRRGTPM